jgi:D-alanyl-D-alanine carboxypeptidase
LLVNPYFRLHDDFEPYELSFITEGSPGRVTPETLRALTAFRAAAAAAGYNLWVASPYRDIALQRRNFENAGGVDGAIARPGHSEHHTGRAVDFGGTPPANLLDGRGPTPTGRWAAENAHRFGFILRYTEENRHITSFMSEPWHFTYVGLEIATAMHEGDYGSLEEYVARHPDAQDRFTRYIEGAGNG